MKTYYKAPLNSDKNIQDIYNVLNNVRSNGIANKRFSSSIGSTKEIQDVYDDINKKVEGSTTKFKAPINSSKHIQDIYDIINEV